MTTTVRSRFRRDLASRQKRILQGKLPDVRVSHRNFITIAALDAVQVAAEAVKQRVAQKKIVHRESEQDRLSAT